MGVAALLLAIGGGWAAARVIGERKPSTESAPTPSQSLTPGASGDSTSDSAAPIDSDDPIALGLPVDNVDCTGEYVVLLASSGNPRAYDATLRPALAASVDAKYLRTSDSCESFNQQLGSNAIYAAYLGPFRTPEEACAARLEVGYAGAYVRRLETTYSGRVVCSCLANAQTPTLSSENAAEPPPSLSYVVSDIQVLLNRAGYNPQLLVGGHYGPQTTTWVRQFQERNDLYSSGEVDDYTWEYLLTYCSPD